MRKVTANKNKNSQHMLMVKVLTLFAVFFCSRIKCRNGIDMKSIFLFDFYFDIWIY